MSQHGFLFFVVIGVAYSRIKTRNVKNLAKFSFEFIERDFFYEHLQIIIEQTSSHFIKQKSFIETSDGGLFFYQQRNKVNIGNVNFIKEERSLCFGDNFFKIRAYNFVINKKQNNHLKNASRLESNKSPKTQGCEQPQNKRCTFLGFIINKLIDFNFHILTL